ncbi:hypothetical protein AVEN_255295-1 [Araneus ventricosus]|uniref:RNase H type-1 domain-containing protein n=1 Tax=Araneus ventricosus TaxID=182803 RepID=A0A4Y2BD11_ARAVE|nr:hypothetical protein AVEN_255295-1 [Araneus ventricosus]
MCALNTNDVSFEVHGFCDASKDANDAAVYLRSISSTGETAMNLLCGESRVAPLKTVSIPCLELCSAELLAKLTAKVMNSLKIDLSRVHLWSDATIMLGWIKINPHLLKTFVANRVNKIQKTTNQFIWQPIRSEENPADLVSRGVSVEKILECSLWWNGPTVLQQESPLFKLYSIFR